MCTLVILHRPGADWPLLAAANRDEMIGRPWAAPARHWPDRPNVVAGLDKLAGGSWLGVNDQGVLAAVMNRTGTLGSVPGVHSRGELVLRALAHPSAAQGAAAMAGLDPGDYRAFNLVVADRRDAFWICKKDAQPSGNIRCERLRAGLSMLTDRDLNDPGCPRIRGYLSRFEDARVPLPGAENGWASWMTLLASRGPEPGAGSRDGICIDDGEFGTLSSSLIGLRPDGQDGLRWLWLFAPGPPDRTPYQEVF